MHGATLEEETQKLRLLQADAGHRKRADKKQEKQNTKKEGQREQEEREARSNYTKNHKERC